MGKQVIEVPFEDYLHLKFKQIYLGVKQESMGFWCLCVYFFFEYTRIQQIYTWLSIIPWTQLSLLGALYFVFSAKKKKPIKDKTYKPSGFGVIFSVFILHILLSCTFAYKPSIAFEYINVMLVWVAMYYCVINLVDDRKRFYIILAIIMLASFKMSQHASISWASRGFAFARWGIAGAPGWFGDAADLGLQMCIFLAFVALYLQVVRKRITRLPKLLLWAMVITAVMTIIAAGNRGTFLALFAMAFTYLLIQRSRIRNLVMLCVFFGLIVWAAPQEFLDRFDTAGDDGTSRERLLLWGRGMEMGETHPVLGVGYYNFQAYNLDVYGHGKVAHSSPVTVIAELGYVGFVIYMALILRIVWANFRTRSRAKKIDDPFAYAMATAIILGVAAYLVSTIFISVAFYPFIYVKMALTTALSRIVFHPDNVELPKKKGRKKSVRVAPSSSAVTDTAT